MKFIFVRLLCGSLAALMLLSLVGCQPADDTGTTTTTVGGNSTTVDGDATTTTTAGNDATTTVERTTTTGEAVQQTTTVVPVATTTTTTKPSTTTIQPTTTTTSVSNSIVTDIHRLQPGITYLATVNQLFSVRSSDRDFTKTQGGYFDGETCYIAVTRQLENGYEDVRILVTDKAGKLLRESDPLPLDHANNITYNPHIDKLVVSHCQSPDGHYYRYSFVDAQALTVTKTGDKEQPFFSMAYSPEKQQYASARWNGETLDFWDKDMNHLFAKDVEKPKSLSQGVFCDAQGVYFIRSEQNGYPSEIRIYDWNGDLQRTIDLKISSRYEPEAISIVDDTTYVIAHDIRKNAVVFSLSFLAEQTQ